MSLLHQIALTQISGVGDITARNLISYCGSAEAVFNTKTKNLLKIPGVGIKTVESLQDGEALRRAEKELKFIERYDIEAYFYTDPQYPKRLKNCVDAPILIFFKGNCDLNKQRIINIVGSRKATDYGKEFTRHFIEEIQQYNPVIVSGLAYGIDVTAHKEALKSGLATIGVLAHGLDKIYPAIHRGIAQKMLENGGLLSEFLSESNADRENFPKRNRIVAGIADATIVVEAGKSGGALITADIANSYNRDVFAVPGRVNDEFSVGCNNLIRDNKAQMITSANDFVSFMLWEDKVLLKNKSFSLFPDLNEQERVIFDVISSEKTICIDDLMAKCNFSSSLMSKILLQLEFNGMIKQLPGKFYVLT